MNIPLKQTLSVHPDPAYKVAAEVDRSPGWLSMVIREMAHPTESEKKKLSEILGKPISELFPAESPNTLEVA